MNPFRLLAVLAALALIGPAAAVASAPGATTGEATNVTSVSATLNGVVNPNKEDTTYYFEYGTTTAYGAKTATATVGGNAGKDVSADITGLTANTLYHFRLVATNPSGTDVGADKFFTTAQSPYVIPPGPIVGQSSITAAANPTIVVFGRSTVISGQYSFSRNAGAQVQLEENPYPYTGGFKKVGNPVVTDSTGKYSVTVKPRLHTRYQVKAGSATSPVVQVRVRTRVSFSVSDSRVSRGQLVRFRGYVSPSHVGRTVRIQRRTASGSFRTIARTTLRRSTGDRSVYSRRIRVNRRGTYRVSMPAHADHLTGTSSRRTIRIG